MQMKISVYIFELASALIMCKSVIYIRLDFRIFHFWCFVISVFSVSFFASIFYETFSLAPFLCQEASSNFSVCLSVEIITQQYFFLPFIKLFELYRT